MKILIAAQKPFSPFAVNRVMETARNGHEPVLLENYADRSDLINAVGDADALIVRSDLVTAEVVNAAPNLKIVVRAGAGYDNIDLDACSKRGIVVMNTPGQNSNAVAELAIGLMIYMSRNAFAPGTGGELRNKRLGIHAYGNVGRLIAALGHGFGMEVCACDPFVNDEVMKNDGVVPIKTPAELYASCDIVSINIPAIPATIKSINADLLGRLKNNAILVNTARKEVIDEDALIDAMRAGRMKYATDVKPACHEKLLESGNRYFATPKKMGAETDEANVNAAVAAINQIIKYFDAGDETFRVNPA